MVCPVFGSELEISVFFDVTGRFQESADDENDFDLG